MKRMIAVGIVAAVSALNGANAQNSEPSRQRGLPPILAALDINTNHVISAEEIANAPTALKPLDKNSDGKLTSDELMPRGAGAPPGGDNAADRKRFTPPFISALDTDSDGTISAEEITKAATALKTLDKNGDGQLSEDEIMPQRPGGRGGPGGPGGPPADR